MCVCVYVCVCVLFFSGLSFFLYNIEVTMIPLILLFIDLFCLSLQYGDYDESTYSPGMLASEDLLPQRVIDQYQMTPEMWEERIKVWYSERRGMTR